MRQGLGTEQSEGMGRLKGRGGIALVPLHQSEPGLQDPLT